MVTLWGRGAPEDAAWNMDTEPAEIDALLKEASGLAAEAADETSAPDAITPPAAPDPALQRILKLRVPVIVQLATRRMPIAAVRDLSTGAIVEFDKSVDDALDLLVNNRLIGRGRCVKVGENFGLQITRICDPVERVRSMGR
jgi:flagellar motor switch protein FliN/FliY